MENNNFLDLLREDIAKNEQLLQEQDITPLQSSNDTNLIADIDNREGVLQKRLEDAQNARNEATEGQNRFDKSEINFFDDKGKTSPARYAYFWKHKGFIRILIQGKDDIIIVKSDNKILEPFNHKTEAISELLKNNPEVWRYSTWADDLLKDKKNINDSWLLLESVPYDLNRDTKDNINLPFKNCVVRITDKDVKMIDYSDESIKFFTKVESLKHEYKPFEIDNREMGMFEKFLTYAIIGRDNIDEVKISDIERKDIDAFCSMIGYLLSNYKNPAQSPAIIFSDDGADGEIRNGGRGKTILTNSLRIFRDSIFKGGKEHDTGYRHNFAMLEPYHDLYIIDDVPAGFDYNSLYTQVTGDITPERKGVTGGSIPFADAPKFIITTNWAVRYDKEATSTNRRFIEYKFSDFWNINNKPDSYFGCTFFHDWGDIEWDRFFQFMIYCGRYFLINGIQKIEYSKEEDNFRAYFENDYKLDVFEKVFKELRFKNDFNVSDFIDEYKNQYPYEREKLFNHTNIKTYIDVYIAKHNLNIEYKKRQRRWYVGDDIFVPSTVTEDDSTVTNSLPF